MSTVDVIVPCYRYGHFLEQCVKSVLMQSGPAVRVLIIDDASPDNTSEVASELARQDPRVTVLHHEQNRGHIASYNEGIAWATAEYLLVLSADDHLLPGALERASLLMDANPEMSLTFGVTLYSNLTGVILWEERKISCREPNKILSRQEFLELSCIENIVATPSAVVRTSVQKKAGGYCAELPHSGDVEMWLRLAAHGSSVGYITTPQAVYRKHNENMSTAYYADFGLGDMKQRELALRTFFSKYAASIAHGSQLYQRAQYRVAKLAVAWASTAWERGAVRKSQELLEFAIRASPNVVYSLPWAKFKVKRTVGVRLYGRVRSLVR